MPKTSLYAQAEAVGVALAAFGSRSMPKLRQSELERIELGLLAAERTLMAIDMWRGQLPAEFVAEREDER